MVDRSNFSVLEEIFNFSSIVVFLRIRDKGVWLWMKILIVFFKYCCDWYDVMVVEIKVR